MSGERLANCPGCGATLEFRFERSILRVCDHCRSLLVRKGADLETLGTVAELVAAPSPVRLGLRGRLRRGGSFTVAGRLQLEWENGAWNEWHLAFADGTTAWLSESMGRWHVMRAARPPEAPPWRELHPDARIAVAGRSFVVTEVRTARFASAEGELPEAVRPGDELVYADLSGPRGELATLDYGTGETLEAFHVGDEISFDELGFDPSELEGPPPEPKAAARALTCPHCGGALELRAPDTTARVGCPYCGSLLDASGDLAVLSAADKVSFRPDIPLGSTGVLDGERWTVIGALERSVTFDGVRYPWREYILHGRGERFRFLVESSGHWMLVGLVPSGAVTEQGDLRIFDGARFKHFQSGASRVDAVVGECYWSVRIGETVQYADHVAPPRILSREADGQEVTWSCGHHVEPGEAWSAFGLRGTPPRRKGVGPAQPSPWPERARRAWLPAAAAAVALLVVHPMLALRERTVFEATFAMPVAGEPLPESVVLSEPFTIDRRGLLGVELSAPVDNSWLWVDSALIDLDRGVVVPFDLEIEYWHGFDGSETWSEGRRATRELIGGVAPGRYRLRLAPQADKPLSKWAVKVTSGAVAGGRLVLALLALLAWPVITGLGWLRFEHQRWSESDHPWTEED